ncbi:FYVE zinc finger, partial [Dillenia turbinata]
MADPLSYANERDIEQALTALKKGSQLIKYSRQGKPKFCPFRLSTDETTLIWYSHGEERNLKLSVVSRIIPGQKTVAVFRRYLRPEKYYLSFSLIYNNGERSLDLICKDKDEAEVWFAGLKALISDGQFRSRRTRNEIPDVNVDVESVQSGRTFGTALGFNASITRSRVSIDINNRDIESSDVGSEGANMLMRPSSAGDGFRLSISSTPSHSSQGSGPDDIESLGDVYVWGEVWSDGLPNDGSVSVYPSKLDILVPKPLESNAVLDVHQIACGVRHVALVTRQGEVITWGEESGGRLGHGIQKDYCRPHLVESLAVTNVDFVSCGEDHTCAISTSGDLFTWGDGTYNAGLLGNCNDVSHWIPKRICGPLEGLQVLSVACGSWHSALAISNGKLFTFGDGTFGVLGHGDRESVSYPKEVNSLNGLRTIKVACGVWHTAAIVEVMYHGGGNVSSRKLFTWGDGDKNRLGHGSKDAYLLPTCVSALIDYNFHQIACGHSMTVALTTSGHVFTMGGTAYGQLGSPLADGKSPCLVQEKLVGEFVEEIACGANHVAVLTSRSEVFTWGRGANGRLGHGDIEDRKSPTLVETLKDRHVKSISCGSNFTASICIHKWVSRADQSVCSGCRQQFGFTRKRHNCYNCGLVHCHACSSKKALRAALAPTPGKPHRVCDSCYAKLKASEASTTMTLYRKLTNLPGSAAVSQRLDGEVKSSRIILYPTTEPIKYLEVRSMRPGSRPDSYSIVRASQVPAVQQLKDISFPSSLSAIQNALKPVIATPQPASNSRSASPYSRRQSPTHAITPVFSRGVIDSLKKSNEVLNQEVSKLQNQVRVLKQKCKLQEDELQQLRKNVTEPALLHEEQSTSPVKKDGIISVTLQLMKVIEKMPPEACDSSTFKAMHAKIEAFLDAYQTLIFKGTSMQDHTVGDLTEVNGVRDLSEESTTPDNGSSLPKTKESVAQTNKENNSRSPKTSPSKSLGQKEVIEQFEPGVYVTVILLQNGAKIFQRVRFSKRRFDENQAEEWCKANKDRLLK